MWSFVGDRKNKRWIWLALCRRIRQVVVAHAIGDWDEAALWQRVPEAYGHGVLYSDFWESYQKVLSESQHRVVGKSEGQTNHVERFVLQERGDARDLLGFVLARLCPTLLKQHKLSYYRH